MTDLEILNQLIRDTAKVPLTVVNHKATVTLTEAQSPNSSVTVNGIPDSSFVIKIDDFTEPKSIFANSKHECKRADYAIVVNNKWIVCIEMKLSGRQSGIQAQLKGAACFMEYCQAIGRYFWEQPQFLTNYDYRFICFTRTSLNKTRTRLRKQSALNDNPENRRINSGNVAHFKLLVGG